MAEFLKMLIDLIQNIWPFRMVYQWQLGLYYIFGRYQWTTKPGLKFIIPYICDVKCVSIVPEIETTPLQTITLRDNRTLTYSASLTIKVVDPAKAYNNVGHWSETVIELAAGVISAELSDADTTRFDPTRGKRDNLLKEIAKEINAVSHDYGVDIVAIRLNNFTYVKTIRLLMDSATLKTNHATIA